MKDDRCAALASPRLNFRGSLHLSRRTCFQPISSNPLCRWEAHTERLWKEAAAQREREDVIFTNTKLNARLLKSEPKNSMRRCELEQRTPYHTRERPHSRKEALHEVHTLPGYEDEVDSD